MRAACCEATVLRNEVIAPDIRLLTVLWPDREHIPHAGQFFTPYDVCRCMAEITFDPKLHPDMEGFISVSDPACGAGATLLAFLNVCKRRNICYHNKVLVIAQDIQF